MDSGSSVEVQRRKLYADRWSSYGGSTGIEHISEMLTVADLKKFPIFRSYDNTTLESIRQDVSVVRWHKGAILFEEGSYLDLAFFIIDGTVEVFLKQQQEGSARPIFANSDSFASTQSAGDGITPTYQDQTVLHTQIMEHQKKADKDSITFLSTMDFDLPYGDVKSLGAGEVFGEIGALSGWPQSVTARTAAACTLLQIRLPALRRMKDESSSFKSWIDQAYRERTLFSQLRTTPLFEDIDASFIGSLTKQVQLVSTKPGEQITQEGTATDALYLVRSGFLKLSQQMGDGNVVVSYLSKGMTLGEVELMLDGEKAWRYTTHAVGYTELVRISLDDFQRLISRYPEVEKRLWERVVARIKDTGRNRRNLDQSALLGFALEKGLAQGNSILVIDLETCTRCDDCVRGCASTHGGRPRFVREGEKYDNFLIARSCYHCEDPVCLIGCPTGAIRRANVGDVVEIDDSLCIGCSNCSRKCPYDAIIMHETGETWPDTTVPEHLRGRPRKVASKCDLCHTSDAGPACVNNCPHTAAVRISSIEAFQQLSEKA